MPSFELVFLFFRFGFSVECCYLDAAPNGPLGLFGPFSFHTSALQRAYRKKHIDINCVDSLGRGALTIAIDAENLEMVELLVIMSVDTKDALLQAINAEFVEAVELLLEVRFARAFFCLFSHSPSVPVLVQQLCSLHLHWQ